VNDASPLRITTLRNHFEHFDERLDEWDATSPNHIFVDRNLGLSLPNMPTINLFRNYDPATGTLHFWGDEFTVPALVDEVRRILPLVEAEAKKPPW
jgi:hypothetical protein